MDVGRQDSRRIGQDHVRADLAVRGFWVKHDALLHEFSAVLESGDLIVEALISQLGVEESDLLSDAPSEQESVTISVGVAAYADDRMQLFADADAALYAAKDAGRNRVIVARPSADGSQMEPREYAD